MESRVSVARRFGGASAAVVMSGFVVAFVGGGVARAADDLVVAPSSVVLGAEVTVDGRCPVPVGDVFVRATVGIEALNRYLVVPVTDGGFRAKVTVAPVDGATAPALGSTVLLQASCRTEAAFVAPAGTTRVAVVSEADAAAAVAPSDGGTSSALSARVPLIAFSVAVVGSLGAYLLSRRSDRRAAAMAGHPAQRGLGRDPRRARR